MGRKILGWLIVGFILFMISAAILAGSLLKNNNFSFNPKIMEENRMDRN